MSEDDTKKHNYLWLDVETTGLDPKTGALLELAYVLAADAQGDTFEEIEGASFVVSYEDEETLEFVLGQMDDYVRNMHTGNRLIEDLRAAVNGEKPADLDGREVGVLTLEGLDTHLGALCERLGAKPRSIVLAGFSVHFDLGWVREYLPRFAGYLSHRVLDVSTLKSWERTQGAGFEGIEGKARPHRALADILVSLDEARQLRDMRWQQSEGGAS